MLNIILNIIFNAILHMGRAGPSGPGPGRPKWTGPGPAQVDRTWAGPSGPGPGRGATTTTTAAATEELSTTSRPHPIMRRDSISRSGFPLTPIYII